MGEIVQLTLTNMTLDVRKSTVIVREGKGTKGREIPLNAKARKALRDYLRLRPNVEMYDLFLGQRNEGAQNKTIQTAVRPFVKKAGLKNITPHTLRRSFAKALVDADVSVEKVATLLGHSNLNTTRIYTASGGEALEDAVGKED
jgi:integrase/recombinase XerD